MSDGERPPTGYAIGVDVGGTNTDVVVVASDCVVRGKALTTYDDFSRGILAGIELCAEQLETTRTDLLAATSLCMNATTVVTNMITELRGAKVGALVTAGFRDTFRLAGGPRLNETDDHLQVNVPDLVLRRAIVEIDERVDHSGAVVVPLDESAVALSAKRLVEEEGVEAIALCFLNSHLNPAHEKRAREIIGEQYPDLFTCMGSNVFPVRGETRRWTTAVLNCFVHKEARVYLDSVSRELRREGLRSEPVFFQGIGGGISRERAESSPLALLASGPAAGASGAKALAQRMGIDRVLVGDMGGTSFDTGVIIGNEVRTTKNIEIGPFLTGVNVVDIISVGAGGGSIAWVGERGTPQVGPRSASSTPGPAALGRGGTEPTVTDALIVLGLIDPANYLRGRQPVDPELARRAIMDQVGSVLGWDVNVAASAIHDIVVANMSNAVRQVSVGRGLDPRSFTFMAYGGTLPLLAGQIADRLGIPEVVIPENSSAFSALGLHGADFVLKLDRTVGWPLDQADGLAEVNTIADAMVAQAHSAIRAEGFADSEITVRRSADLRFQGQIFELTLPLPDRPLNPDDLPKLAADFHRLYEDTYGAGTVWRGADVLLLNLSVTAGGRQAHRSPFREEQEAEPFTPEPVGARLVHLPMAGTVEEVPVHAAADFGPGAHTVGPAIVDEGDTTIFAPPGHRLRRDGHFTYILSREGGR
ncbi:hydantoinase/oxoprolinase family protein [Acrocarpospora sp. B8E8]|uniref:hydantoinase/oxoprolinase family protein n=1 Tax=Acrocarpospora sp. B8E8 TaxID=3153572 RepID=UPI00325DF32A